MHASVSFSILSAAVPGSACCLAAGNDLDSQLLSDREQMEFLSAWAKKHAPR